MIGGLGALTPEDVVTYTYVNTFNRLPTPEEVAFQVGAWGSDTTGMVDAIKSSVEAELYKQSAQIKADARFAELEAKRAAKDAQRVIDMANPYHNLAQYSVEDQDPSKVWAFHPTLQEIEQHRAMGVYNTSEFVRYGYALPQSIPGYQYSYKDVSGDYVGVTMSATAINNLYRQYLGRNASQEEIAWRQSLSNVMTLADMANDIANSVEAQMFRQMQNTSNAQTAGNANVNQTSNVGNAGTGQNSGSNVVGGAFFGKLRTQLDSFGVPDEIMGIDSLYVLAGAALVAGWYMTKGR